MKHTAKQQQEQQQPQPQQRNRMLSPVSVAVVLMVLTLKVLYHSWTSSTCVDWNDLLLESTQQQQNYDREYISQNHQLNDPLLNNPRTGYFPGWDEGTPIDRNSLTSTTREFVPKRLIAVFGLESSGTTFVQRTLAAALKANLNYEVEYHTANRDIRIQHFSLPTGVFRKNSPNLSQQFLPLPLVPVHVPYQCRKSPSVPDSAVQSSPKKCHVLFGPHKVNSVERYFVNITSHMQFYQKRGIHATAVVVVRDPAMHFKGITKTHSRGNQTAAYEQYQTGRALIQEAMERLVDPDSLVIVSYETLMTLRQVYVKQLYSALGIDSNYAPSIQNGNLAYVPKGILSDAMKSRLANDTGTLTAYTAMPKNLYELKSYQQLLVDRRGSRNNNQSNEA
jgi:Sulfotransferase family